MYLVQFINSKLKYLILESLNIKNITVLNYMIKYESAKKFNY